MKNLILFLSFFAFNHLYAQTTTYYLIRHAEKDTSAAGSTQMQANPPLSNQGKERAEKLAALMEKEGIDFLFSTDYLRTKSTLAPLATKIGKPIQIYSPNQQAAWADTLRQPPFRGKKLLIAGHSNTIPILANLLIGQKKYENLADNEYGLIFQITIEGDQFKDSIWRYWILARIIFAQ